MNRAGPDQLEERHLGLELGPVAADHLEGSRHRAEGRRERAARGVFEALAGLEDGLLADDAGAVDLLGMARPVDDRPVAIDQLDRRIRPRSRS